MKKLLTLMLLSVFAIVQASAITVYAKFNGNALNVHYWGNESTSWPGVAMDKKYDSNGDTWFTKTFNAPNFIFNLGNGQHQTGNIQGVNNDAAYIVTDGTSSLSYTSTSIPTNLSDNPPTNPSFDPTARKFAVTGDAVGGWNMPPSSNQYFTNKGDGTYTWTGNVSRTGFKLTGVAADYNITNWDSFNSGLFGKAGLVEGDNTLTSGYDNDLTMPVSGDVTLTISNVTDSSCKLNITVNQVVVIDPAFYLVGATNSWTYPNDDKFTESNGVFTLTKTFSGQFKIRDENGAWFGTGVTFTEDNNTTTLDNNNGNMTLSEESEYTLTIDPTSMLLTITGFPSNVQPVEPYATIYIDKTSATGNIYAYDQPDNQNYGGWPGTSIQGLETGTKDNVEYYVFKFTHENANSPIVIFSNGNGSQTENIGVADGDVLKYLGDNSYILNGTQHPPVVAEPYATIYIDKASAVGNIYAYDQPDNQNYGGWPGTSIQGLETGTKDNVEYYVFKFTHENANSPIVIFNGGDGQPQTANIPVADGDVLKYLGGNSYILNGVQYPLNRLYLMGLGDWSNGEEMTLGQDGKFTITKTMDAGAEFKFRDDTQWYGPVSEGNFEVTEEQVKNGTELSLTTDSGERNFTIPVAGEWTLTVDKANMKLVISGNWPTTFDPTKRKFAMTGPAVSDGYDPANPVYFTNNGDGTYTWTGAATNQEFRLTGVGENDPITSWETFNAGLYGKQTVIIGNNTLSSGFPAGYDMYMPLSGNLVLTISDVTENSCVLNIAEQPDPLFYIAGTFTNWEINMQQMSYDSATESFSITVNGITDGAEFKFVDQDNKWYGVTPQSGDNYIVSIDDCTQIPLEKDGGNNIKVSGSGNLTFTVNADKELTISRWDVPGITLAEALAGQAGEVTIKSDMVVVTENGSYAIVSDGEGNWLKLIGPDSFHNVNTIYRVTGTISDLNLNPVMYVNSFHESDAAVTVQPRSIILVEASEEEITTLKPNEVATICGYYNATEHKLFANSPGSPQRKCMAVTLDHLVGTLPDGKAVSVTGVLSLNEPWETPAGGPARASKDDEGYLNYTLDATSWSPATGVNDIKAIDGKEVVGIYNVNGQQVKNADHGVYIIRYSDGTAAKVRF